MDQTQSLKRLDASRLQKGDIISETQYYEIVDKQYNPLEGYRTKVKNERGFEFLIGDKILEEGSYSASQYNQEQKVTLTELVNVLANVGDTVFEAGFYKQPDSKVINATIEASNKGKIKSVADMKKDITTAFKGEFRVFVGYLDAVETGLGRSRVIDLKRSAEDVAKKGRFAQIDHRTLTYIIYKNVKYSLK